MMSPEIEGRIAALTATVQALANLNPKGAKEKIFKITPQILYTVKDPSARRVAQAELSRIMAMFQ